MPMILHILKKDLRRHWPEVLVSLVLLGLYTRLISRARGTALLMEGGLFSFFASLAQSFPALLILFWIFLAIRLLQGEPLVGNRQWWITKPYEWPVLLAAKLLFLFVCIAIPLFFVQLFLLHRVGFPIPPCLRSILIMQLELALVLALPSVALGCLLKGLGQALVVVVLIFVGFYAGLELLFLRVPGFAIYSSVDSSGNNIVYLLPAALAAAILLQYARRETWLARALIVAALALVILSTALTPYAKLIDQKYPLATPGQEPARLTLAAHRVSSKVGSYLTSNFGPHVYLQIPLAFSGIAPQMVLAVFATKISVEPSSATPWTSGWTLQFIHAWSDDNNRSVPVSFDLERKVYDRIKNEPAHLRIELAVIEYQPANPRNLLVPAGPFRDPQLGICALSQEDSPMIYLTCRRPFTPPGLIATFDPSSSPCSENSAPSREHRVFHELLSPHEDDAPTAGLNPIAEYSLAFNSNPWFAWRGESTSATFVRLCPGAVIQLAAPQPTTSSRIVLDLDNVKLHDLVEPFSDAE